MGLGLAGIGMAVMHDGNHGAYSENKTINKIVGGVLELVGGNNKMWQIQHNVLHHTFTNIDGLDEDIDPGPVLRFSPLKPLKPWHRFQHYYAWFFYGLMTLLWVTIKDFIALNKYEKVWPAQADGQDAQAAHDQDHSGQGDLLPHRRRPPAHVQRTRCRSSHRRMAVDALRGRIDPWSGLPTCTRHGGPRLHAR